MHLLCWRRHHVFVKIPKSVQLAEVGPRFEMKRNHISDYLDFDGLTSR
jgi:rRNA maturation protein Rpf1